MDGDFADLLESEGGGLADSANNDLRVNTLLNELLALAQELTGKERYTGRTIADLEFRSKENISPWKVSDNWMKADSFG